MSIRTPMFLMYKYYSLHILQNSMTNNIVNISIQNDMIEINGMNGMSVLTDVSKTKLYNLLNVSKFNGSSRMKRKQIPYLYRKMRKIEF